MSTVNDNNIDDLMRRASEKYPLRTDSADWDRLADALERDPSMILPPVQADGRGRRRRRVFWLFLLLPLGGLGYYIWHSAGHPSVSQQAIVRMPQDNGKAPGSQAKDAERSLGRGADRGLGEGAGKRFGNDADKGGLKDAADRGKDVADDARNGAGNDEVRVAGNDIAKKGSKARELSGSGTSVNGSSKTGASVTGLSLAGPSHTGSSLIGSSVQAGHQPGNLSVARAQIAGNAAASIKGRPLLSCPGGAAKDTAHAKPQKAKKRESSIYFGLLAAPDLSMVKFQSVKGVGFTGGLLLGYNFNRKWALETGLCLDKKKYYTEGEYFSRKNVQFPAYYDLLNVNGSCHMLEIPLNIRYNLYNNGKTKWFATAGLSTYLMFKEAYNYNYLWNGFAGDSAFAYKQPYQYWFSVINLSLGYEHTLGKVGQLRIEPYWRIPTSGIGKGVLPVMSAGLNIGITRRIW